MEEVRRGGVRAAVLALGAAVWLGGGAPAWSQGQPKDFSSAVQALAREKSLAEGYVALLNEFGKKNLGRYADGVALYAEAKAEFDGLIEKTKYLLVQGRPPAETPEFSAALRAAVGRRVAFTEHIKTVVDAAPGHKGGAVLAPLLPELLKTLTEAGEFIWKEFRSGKDQRRKEILAQLEGLKWQEFAKIGAR